MHSRSCIKKKRQISMIRPQGSSRNYVDQYAKKHWNYGPFIIYTWLQKLCAKSIQ